MKVQSHTCLPKSEDYKITVEKERFLNAFLKSIEFGKRFWIGLIINKMDKTLESSWFFFQDHRWGHGGQKRCVP